MATLTYWLKTYWYAPLIILIGGFFFWQQAKAGSANQPLSVSVNSHSSSHMAASRSSRATSMSGSHRPSHGFVHLKGAIQHPGIYPVKENTRWDEVVKAAGGLTAAADIQQVNLNKADVAQLTTISGIGPKKAADIISYRDSHGGFKDINELKEVHGIGDKTFETLAPQLTVGP